METNSEILSRLKLIGKIQLNEKLSTQDLSLHANGWWTSLIRTFINPDSRSNTKDFIEKIINRSFERLETAIATSDDSLTVSISIDMRKAQRGLDNLKQTYESDKKFGCDIEVLVQHIDSKMGEFSKRASHLDLKSVEDLKDSNKE